MTPEQAKSLLRTAMRANRPAFLRGAPGIGKSAIVWQVARELDLPVIEIRASMIDPVDLRGIPTIENGYDDEGAVRERRTVWARPSFLPSEPAILFLDEMNAAPPLVQASFYQLMLTDGDGHRAVGEHRLHAETRVVGAGNREEDRAVVQQMPTPLRIGRMIMIDVEASLPDFCAWGMQTGRIAPEVLAFVNFRPALLHAFDPDAMVSPAPRSYEVLSDLLRVGIPAEIEVETIEGCLGRAAAAEMVGFLRIARGLPMPADVIANPESAPVPAEPAARYAISTALAAVDALDAKAFARAMLYMHRLSAEYQVLFIKSATTRKPELQETKTFIEWANRNVALFTG